MRSFWLWFAVLISTSACSSDTCRKQEAALLLKAYIDEGLSGLNARYEQCTHHPRANCDYIYLFGVEVERQAYEAHHWRPLSFGVDGGQKQQQIEAAGLVKLCPETRELIKESLSTIWAAE